MLAFTHVESGFTASCRGLDFDEVLPLGIWRILKPTFDTDAILRSEELGEVSVRVGIDYIGRFCTGICWEVWALVWHVQVPLMDFRFVTDRAEPVVSREAWQAGCEQLLESLYIVIQITLWVMNFSWTHEYFTSSTNLHIVGHVVFIAHTEGLVFVEQ